jgi:hypothetical protein
MDQCDVIYKPGEPLEYEDGNMIFVKTDYITEFFSLKKDKKFIILSANSDYSPSIFFNQEDMYKLLEDPHLVEWRAQNSITEHPKLTHIPMGLENTPSKITFCLQNFERLRLIPKKDEVYSNFEISNNPHERGSFPTVTGDKLDYETYMNTMATYKYAMCPMGNGMDTHRFWEAQVCGTIPIIRCPKEFLKTYQNVAFISLPGFCAARLGHPNHVFLMESLFKINNAPFWDPTTSSV